VFSAYLSSYVRGHVSGNREGSAHQGGVWGELSKRCEKMWWSLGEVGYIANLEKGPEESAGETVGERVLSKVRGLDASLCVITVVKWGR